jgi:hypothetical protein
MLSDLVLSAFSLIFFFRIKELDKNWSLFFAFMSLSALSGAIYHGYTHIGEGLRFFSWSMLAVSIIFAQRASYKEYESKLLNSIFLFNGALFLSLAIYNADFIYMVLNIVVGLFGFVVLGGLIYLKGNSNKIIYGILISFTSVFFVIAKISVDDKYLNFNDIGHYISVISLYVMTLGIKEDVLCEKCVEKVKD